MATHEANRSLGGMIQNHHVERDMDMAEAEEASCAAGQRTRRTTRVSFMVASEQWERHTEWKKTEERELGASKRTGRLEETDGASSEASAVQGDSAAPTYRQDG